MNISITTSFITLSLAFFLALGVAITPVLAETHTEDEHAEEMHDEEVSHDDHEAEHSDDEARIEQMKQVVALLTQLVALLTQQNEVAMAHNHDDGTHEHEDEHEDEHGDEVEPLEVRVELHSDRTHVHVVEDGVETHSFFLDDLAVTQEDEIIAAIAEETGLSEHDIEAVVTFPSDKDEHEDEDEHEDDHDEDTDLDGIHIMGDGTVMLGNGEVVEDATVTEDGMIMLANGEMVEPEFDLR